MKKYFQLFASFLASFCYTQNYLPMLDEDNVWSVEINHAPFGDDWPPATVAVQVNIDGTKG